MKPVIYIFLLLILAPTSIKADSLSTAPLEECYDETTVDASADLSNEEAIDIRQGHQKTVLMCVSDTISDFVKGLITTINGIIYITGLGTILWVGVKFYKRRKRKIKGQEINPTQDEGTSLESPKREDNPNVVVNPPKVKDKPDVPLMPPKSGTVAVRISAKEDSWMILGASVQGNGHISSNTPCQDFCAHEALGRGWGIAIVSDGAGSAKHSNIGSQITASRTMYYMKKIVEREGWIDKSELPSDAHWTKLAFTGLKSVRDDIYLFAKQKDIEANTLNATVIVVIYSPMGLLVAHVGDGRAGYRNTKGEWTALITPHKGEEANQTIFIPSNFWDIPFFLCSDVLVPEARVIREKATAFTLMSDGCERASWLYNQRNDHTGKFYDPNVPFDRFFNPVIERMRALKRTVPVENMSDEWASYIKDGTDCFKQETDDKTMIVGYIEEE